MDFVSAIEASAMTGLSERTIRRMISRGKLPARYANARRYEIAVKDLPTRKISPTHELATRVAVLEERVQRLTQLVEALVGARTLPPVAQPSDFHYSASGGHSDAPAWRTYTDAARWLEQHGVAMNTARQWYTQARGAIPLERSAILRDALQRAGAGDFRVPWRLHRCDDPHCPCAQLLSVE